MMRHIKSDGIKLYKTRYPWQQHGGPGVAGLQLSICTLKFQQKTRMPFSELRAEF